MARNRHSRGEKQFLLYARDEPNLPRRVLTRITFEEGELRVTKNQAVRVRNAEGTLVGYQICESVVEPSGRGIYTRSRWG